MLSIYPYPPLKCQHYFGPGPSSFGVKRIRSAYAMSSSGVKRAYAEASPLPNFFSPLPSCNPASMLRDIDSCDSPALPIRGEVSLDLAKTQMRTRLCLERHVKMIGAAFRHSRVKRRRWTV